MELYVAPGAVEAAGVSCWEEEAVGTLAAGLSYAVFLGVVLAAGAV